VAAYPNLSWIFYHRELRRRVGVRSKRLQALRFSIGADVQQLSTNLLIFVLCFGLKLLPASGQSALTTVCTRRLSTVSLFQYSGVCNLMPDFLICHAVSQFLLSSSPWSRRCVSGPGASSLLCSVENPSFDCLIPRSRSRSHLAQHARTIACSGSAQTKLRDEVEEE
jgi:hypothetical protein